MARSGRRTQRSSQNRRQQRGSGRKPSKGQKRRGTKKLNEFMRRKEQARKGNKSEFQYKGNTYVRGETSTGMVVYSRE